MVRSALTVPEKAEILRAYRAGASLRSISRTLGRTMEALRTLVAATGGRPPLVPRRSARWLALAEREEISRGIVAGHSCRLIGGCIRRAGSTVSIRDRQERGSPPLPRVPGGAGTLEQGPPSQRCETRRLSAVAAGGRSEARVTLVSPADRWLAGESVSRRSGAAGVARDDQHVVVWAAAGRAAEGADPVPPIAPHGPSAARGTSGQWPGPTAKRGQHQRPSRRGGRPRRAWALGRRPPTRTRQQRDRDAR